MATIITITVPDDMDTEEVADYTLFVSQQIREGFTSGHVAPEHYWESEGL